MTNRIKLALATATVALLAPTTAAACDLDGMDGMHRMNPFGAMGFGRGAPMPLPAPAEREPASAEPTVNRGDRNAKEKAESQPLPTPKWEQQGDSAPVSREDLSTFT